MAQWYFNYFQTNTYSTLNPIQRHSFRVRAFEGQWTQERSEIRIESTHRNASLLLSATMVLG